MLNRDIVTSLTLLALCLFSWTEIKDISKLGRFYPKICIFVLAFLSLLLLLTSLKKKYETKMFEGINLKYVKLMTIGFIFYVIGIYLIGFFIASFLFLMSFGLILNCEPQKKAILHSAVIGLATTTLFYFFFKQIFSVPLPPGLFFGG